MDIIKKLTEQTSFEVLSYNLLSINNKKIYDNLMPYQKNLLKRITKGEISNDKQE